MAAFYKAETFTTEGFTYSKVVEIRTHKDRYKVEPTDGSSGPREITKREYKAIQKNDKVQTELLEAPRLGYLF